MSWGSEIAGEMGATVLRFGFIAAGAGFAFGIIIGLLIGWLMFGGGA